MIMIVLFCRGKNFLLHSNFSSFLPFLRPCYCSDLKAFFYYYVGFPGSSEVKAFACNVGDPGLIPGWGRFPWRRKWQPTPVFLPGESHGQRSLMGFSPRGRKESDTTERLHLHLPRDNCCSDF